MNLCYFTQNQLRSSILVLYTLIATCLVVVLSKRATYLIAAPNPAKSDQTKIATVFAISICAEWSLVLSLKEEYDSHPARPDRMLCELLLFENIMLTARFIFGFLKYTLSLWCLLTGNDFRVKFAWYLPMKTFLVIINFAVIFALFYVLQ